MAGALLSALGDIETAIWQELSRAVDERSHEWHTPVLASVANGSEGNMWPDARTVVLRSTDPAARRLLVYTDSRAPKVGQLKHQPQAMLVFWSRTLGWQLRCRVTAEVEEEGLAVSSHWARIRLTHAAQDYLSALPPGTPLATPAHPVERREHFAMLALQVHAVDWLELAAAGHRRASFAGGSARWLQP